MVYIKDTKYKLSDNAYDCECVTLQKTLYNTEYYLWIQNTEFCIKQDYSNKLKAPKVMKKRVEEYVC